MTVELRDRVMGHLNREVRNLALHQVAVARGFVPAVSPPPPARPAPVLPRWADVSVSEPTFMAAAIARVMRNRERRDRQAAFLLFGAHL